MTRYFVQVRYTPETWAALVKNPQDRQEAVRPVIEAVGGSYDHAWIAPGEGAVLAVMQLPDEATLTALTARVLAGGGVQTLHATPIITTAESVAALERAGTIGDQPPG
jgi:uncharacterized protein with GYD domain